MAVIQMSDRELTRLRVIIDLADGEGSIIRFPRPISLRARRSLLPRQAPPCRAHPSAGAA